MDPSHDVHSYAVVTSGYILTTHQLRTSSNLVNTLHLDGTVMCNLFRGDKSLCYWNIRENTLLGASGSNTRNTRTVYMLMQEVGLYFQQLLYYAQEKKGMKVLNDKVCCQAQASGQVFKQMRNSIFGKIQDLLTLKLSDCITQCGYQVVIFDAMTLIVMNLTQPACSHANLSRNGQMHSPEVTINPANWP
ncbi:hypothetical protein Tco_0217485 [Tanacetum coccineum]